MQIIVRELSPTVLFTRRLSLLPFGWKPAAAEFRLPPAVLIYFGTSDGEFVTPELSDGAFVP